MIKIYDNFDRETYDALVIPTGETTFGDRAFPVTKKAIDLFKTGKYGCIFVTGGHGGFAVGGPGKVISEAQDTVGYLLMKGIPEEKIYYDDQSLESVGNFTFPLVRNLEQNPRFDEFENLRIIAKKGHKWRLEDYAELVLPKNMKVGFKELPGEHNNGPLAWVYHKGLMHVVGKEPGAEDIHRFLMKEHPFYSKGWYEKSPSARKLETTITGLSWFLM